MSINQSNNSCICKVTHQLHKIWKDSFKDGISKSVNESTSAVNEEDVSEPIPFRLEKYDVLPQMFHVNVKVKSAVSGDDVQIPYWGDATPYPFANIVGGSLWEGVAAASGFERGFTKDTYEKNSGNILLAVRKQQEIYSDIITTQDVVFHQKVAINDRRDGGGYGTPISDAPQNYSNVTKSWVAQQVYDLNDNGEIVVNPEYHGSILMTPNRKKSREICKLVKIQPKDVAFQCGIMGKIGCMKFMQNIAPIVQNNRVDVNNLTVLRAGGRNPNYGKFTDYFSGKGCVLEDGRIDVQKYMDLIRTDKVSTDEFVGEFLMNYMLCSDPSRTYVWVPVTDARAGDCEKDVAIFNALTGGGAAAESTENESSELTEAISGLSDETGDIVGDTWRETFFNSIVSAKQQASKRVLTFVTKGRQKQVTILKDVLNQGLTGLTREFIYIDDVASDVKGLDYSSFFADERFKEILNKSAIKKFTCKKISGICIGFPYNPEIEKARVIEQQKRQKIDNHKFLNDYIAAYSVNSRDLGGFHVTLVCPAGSGNNIKSYFFFRGYDQIGNPKVSGITPPSDEVIANVVPSDENSLLSTIWYNESTSKTNGKINLPTNARASQRSASGRTVGYKNAEIPG